MKPILIMLLAILSTTDIYASPFKARLSYEDGSASIKFEIEPGNILYSRRLSVQFDPSSTIEIHYPVAEKVKVLSEMKLGYVSDVTIPVSIKSINKDFPLTVSYQGCNINSGTCYLPQSKAFTLNKERLSNWKHTDNAPKVSFIRSVSEIATKARLADKTGLIPILLITEENCLVCPSILKAIESKSVTDKNIYFLVWQNALNSPHNQGLHVLFSDIHSISAFALNSKLVIIEKLSSFIRPNDLSLWIDSIVEIEA